MGKSIIIKLPKGGYNMNLQKAKYIGVPEEGYIGRNKDAPKKNVLGTVLGMGGLGVLTGLITGMCLCVDKNIDDQLKANTKPVGIIYNGEKKPYLLARENFLHEMNSAGIEPTLNGRERWEGIISEYNQHLKGQPSKGDTLYLLDYKPFDGEVLPE